MNANLFLVGPDTKGRSLYANGNDHTRVVEGKIKVAGSGTAHLSAMNSDGSDALHFELAEGPFELAVQGGGSLCITTGSESAAICFVVIEEQKAVQQPDTTAVIPAAATPDAPASSSSPRVEITSPMIGVFYRAVSPDADPFIEVNDPVVKTTAICIIEAMKVLNEIKAEMDGVVLEILVQNGESVEFGQPLFLIRPTEPTTQSEGES